MADTSSMAAIVIPARYNSTRLAGKPLEHISGRTMIHRVWSIARAVEKIQAVYVATDDDRIADHVRGFGGCVIMTSKECDNGTERVLKAVESLQLPPAIVVNLQGDAVLTPPWVIQALVNEMQRDHTVLMATTAVRMNAQRYDSFRAAKQNGEVGGTTVVFDRRLNALYFSKSVIPFVRIDAAGRPNDPLPVYRHIGLYAYRFDTLRQLAKLIAGPLEQAEKLEQLRALEHGIPIRVVEVDYRGRTHWAVDSREDIGRVEDIIRVEGELLPV